MKLIFIFITSLVFFVFSINEIREKLTLNTDYRIDSYKIFQKENDKENLLSIFTQSENQDKWIIFNSKGEKILEKENIKGYSQTIFDNRIFFLAERLSSFKLSNFSILHYNVKNDNYLRINLTRFGLMTLLIASNDKNIDIYNINDSNLVQRISREDGEGHQIMKFYDGKIIYNYKKNGIAVYNLTQNRHLWNYDTGTISVSLLGISVGSTPNLISDVEIDNKCLLMMTFGGDIYKFDLENGKVLQKKERFKGKGNNAGLLPYFDLVDMNNDGVKDILGGSVDNNVYCINGKDFSIIWEYDTDNEIQLPLSFYDINGDKIPEVFTVNDYDNNLFILDGKTGKLLFKKSIKDKSYKKLIQTSVSLADFDGDGLLDLIVKRNPGTIQVYEMSDVKVPANSIIYSP